MAEELLAHTLRRAGCTTRRTCRCCTTSTMPRAPRAVHATVDYMVKDGEVVIVDSSPAPVARRRWSGRLHQAVEAKETVKIDAQDSKSKSRPSPSWKTTSASTRAPGIARAPRHRSRGVHKSKADVFVILRTVLRRSVENLDFSSTAPKRKSGTRSSLKSSTSTPRDGRCSSARSRSRSRKSCR